MSIKERIVSAILASGISLLAGSPVSAETPMPSCKFPGALCGYVNARGDVLIEPKFDTAEEFIEGRARVRVGDFFGLMDPSGTYIAPPVYQAVSHYWNGLAQVHRDGVTALIDRGGAEIFRAEGEIVIPIDDTHMLIGTRFYDSRELGLGFRNQFGRHGLVMLSRNLWSVYHVSTGQRSEPVLSDIRFVSQEIGSPFWQIIKGDYFLVDTDGTRITDGFDYAGELSNGAIPVRLGSWSALITKKGEIVQEKLFEGADFFYEDRWTTFRQSEAGTDKFGYVDRTGTVVIPAQFDSAGQFRGDVADVTLNGWRIQIDRSGERVGGCLDDVIVKKMDGNYYVVRVDGTKVTDQSFGFATASCNQPTRIITHDNQRGFITRDGKLLGQRYYEGASPFHDGVAAVWLPQDRFGIIDTTGEFVVPPLKLKAKIISTSGYAVINPGPDHVKLTRAVADQLARDPTLLTTVPIEPDPGPSCHDDGVNIVLENGMRSYRDVTGARFIDAEFDHATCFQRGYAKVAIPERREWCEIDKRGKIREGSCGCHQPLIIFEFGSGPKMTDEDIDCYAFGLRVLQQYSSRE